MKAFERRVKDLEKGMSQLPPPGGRTVSQQLTAERYVILMIQGRKIPKTLQKQHARLPLEEVTPAVLALIDAELERTKDIEMEMGEKEYQAFEREWKEKRGL